MAVSIQHVSIIALPSTSGSNEIVSKMQRASVNDMLVSLGFPAKEIFGAAEKDLKKVWFKVGPCCIIYFQVVAARL